MVRKIIKYPAEALRKPTQIVQFPLTEGVKEHIQDLKDTLAATPEGLALASNQILEEGFRIFVVRPDKWAELDLPVVLINPTWYQFKTESRPMTEGCLSVPNFATQVARCTHIVVEYQIESGQPDHFIPFKELGAQVVQHECDHLEGKLIVDGVDVRTKARLWAAAIRERKAGR